MKLEDALPYLRKGGSIYFQGQKLSAHSLETSAMISVGDLLSEEWNAQLTDDQILNIWEEDITRREKTGQPAQAALLRDCVKLLRTRKL